MPSRPARPRPLPGMAALQPPNKLKAAIRKKSRPDLEGNLAFQIRALGLPPGERNALFHPTRKWRVDFLWRTEKLGVEVEGGTWTGGRHVHPQGFEADCIKYNELVLSGVRLLRVTGAMVNDGRAVRLIWRALGGASAVRSARTETR